MPVIEKRRHIRINMVTPLEVKIYSGNKLMGEEKGRTLNISQGGALIEVPFPIDKGQQVAMTISLGEEFAYISGRVIHRREEQSSTYQAGIEFLSIDETGKKLLAQYIQIFMNGKKEPAL